MNTATTKPGHAAALAWYADLWARIDAAEGSHVDSQLTSAYGHLPTVDQSDFLDALGAMVVDSQISGSPDPALWCPAEQIALGLMTPEQQDRWAHEQDLRGVA